MAIMSKSLEVTNKKTIFNNMVKKTISIKGLSSEFIQFLRIHPFATIIHKNSIMFMVPDEAVWEFEGAMLDLASIDKLMHGK